MCEVKRISGIYCDCCGAAWVAGVGFPCKCMTNEYCSTCLYCAEHCECGDEQDLRSDPYAAATVRMARRIAGEWLPPAEADPEIRARRVKSETVIGMVV
jgi:hypothetical protein